jgi:phosphoribosyl-dephospho-CoA transferase
MVSIEQMADAIQDLMVQIEVEHELGMRVWASDRSLED